MSVTCETTRFGFIYGAMHVERIGQSPKGHTAIYVSGSRGRGIEVTVSPAGQAIRVHGMDGQEWKPQAVADSQTGLSPDTVSVNLTREEALALGRIIDVDAHSAIEKVRAALSEGKGK
jgi:predicted secreted hydrolase